VPPVPTMGGAHGLAGLLRRFWLAAGEPGFTAFAGLLLMSSVMARMRCASVVMSIHSSCLLPQRQHRLDMKIASH
jgi:hypothetical protein